MRILRINDIKNKSFDGEICYTSGTGSIIFSIIIEIEQEDIIWIRKTKEKKEKITRSQIFPRETP